MNESQPSQNQLDVMRYADGELPANEAQSMEQRLATDPSLRRELAAYQTLEVLARNTAPPEPADLEWQQLRSGTVHRGVGLVSWLLIGVSSLGYFSWVCLFCPDVVTRMDREWQTWLEPSLSVGSHLLEPKSISFLARSRATDGRMLKGVIPLSGEPLWENAASTSRRRLILSLRRVSISRLKEWMRDRLKR